MHIKKLVASPFPFSLL